MELAQLRYKLAKLNVYIFNYSDIIAMQTSEFGAVL
jgi:hypothetical protein